MICSHENKKLITHLKNVSYKAKKCLQNKKLNLDIIKKENLIKLMYIISISHDFGKCTEYFQNYLKDNRKSGRITHHGLISALFGYSFVNYVFQSEKYAMIAYIVIKNHHGNLKTPYETIDNNLMINVKHQINNISKEMFKDVESIYNKLIKKNNVGLDKTIRFSQLWNYFKKNYKKDYSFNFMSVCFQDNNISEEIQLFLLINLLYSILIDFDKKDAADIDIDLDINHNYFSIEEYLSFLREKNPRKFDTTSKLNRIREKFRRETVNNKNIKVNNKIYTLTAPTGIGKTFTAVNVAEKLKKKIKNKKRYIPRIIYNLPYTSIIDQNYEEIKKILKYHLPKDEFYNNLLSYLYKHHYLSKVKEDIDIDNETDMKKYIEKNLFYNSWESLYIVTTFVQIFESIIGYSNRYLKKFHNIVNSIIIFDEIQSLNQDYYKLIRKVFEILSEKFNTYLIFMTATQPKIISENKLTKLTISKKYFLENEFNRVRLKIINNLQPFNLEEFKEYFKEDFKYQNGLIVCNTKKSANRIYSMVNKMSYDNYELYLLTTYFTPFDRLNKIREIKNKLKNGEKIITVTTQLIEAGVDISFKSVYRDFAPFDSIVQVAGRCNRSNEYDCGIMNLFKLRNENNKRSDSEIIYPNILLQYTRKILSENCYQSKDFYRLSKKYFSKFDFKMKSDELIKAIESLNYSKKHDGKSVKDFKVIKNNYKDYNLIICKEKEIQDKISKIKKIKKNLKRKDFNKDEYMNKFMKIKILMKELQDYMISLSYLDIKDFIQSKFSNKLNDEMYYVNYNDYDKIYNNDFGFLKKPKEDSNIVM